MVAEKNSKKIDKNVRERLTTYEQRRQEFLNKQAKRRRINTIAIASMVIVVVLAISAGVIALFVMPQPEPEDPIGLPTNAANVPSPDLSEQRTWTGSMTVGGVPLTFELDGVRAPQATASTITLVKDGFYEGLTCHRLSTQEVFLFQCGDPQGDGFGGPGFYYGPLENTPVDNFYPAGSIVIHRHIGNYSSMGSQFFIVYQDTFIPGDNNGGYTVVGKITSGLDQLVSQVVSQGTADGSSDGPPALPVTLTELSVQ